MRHAHKTRDMPPGGEHFVQQTKEINSMQTTPQIRQHLKLAVSIISLFSLNSASQAGQVEISQDNLFVPHGIARKAQVIYDADSREFTALVEGSQKTISRHNISGIPANISENQMETFANGGGIYFSLGQIGDDLSLSACGRLRGGVKLAKAAGASDETAGLVGAGVGGAAGTIAGAIIGSPGGPVGAAAGGLIGMIAFSAAAAGSPPPPQPSRKR